MDPSDGEVLALANWPRVDANKPRSRARLRARRTARRLTYEPGSTFKAFTVAGALEDGRRHARHALRPPAADPGRRPHDRRVAPARRRALTTARSSPSPATSARSRSACGWASEALRLVGAQLRLRQPTGVDLPGEERGSCSRSNKYSGSSMGNLPIGQGMAVTPMQMAQAYAAIANGGVLRTPHLVAPRRRQAVADPRGRRVISGETAMQLRRCSRALRAGRHGQRGQDPGLQAGGQDRHGEQDRPATGEYSEVALRRLVHRLRAGAAPEAADRGDGRRAAGRDLRRRGRRAGVRQDRSFALQYQKIPPR